MALQNLLLGQKSCRPNVPRIFANFCPEFCPEFCFDFPRPPNEWWPKKFVPSLQSLSSLGFRMSHPWGAQEVFAKKVRARFSAPRFPPNQTRAGSRKNATSKNPGFGATPRLTKTSLRIFRVIFNFSGYFHFARLFLETLRK